MELRTNPRISVSITVASLDNFLACCAIANDGLTLIGQTEDNYNKYFINTVDKVKTLTKSKIIDNNKIVFVLTITAW